MKDHWSQITMANRKGSSLKYHRNYQKVAQRYGVNKYCWRNAWCRLPQIFNLWKTWYLWTAVKQYTLKVPVVVPQRLPPPNHQNLSMCQVTRQRRMEVAMALRLLISWPHSRGESTPSRQVQCNRRVLTSGRGRNLGSQRDMHCEKNFTHHCWRWRWRKPKIKTTSRLWKRQGNRLSPGVPGKKHNPADILVLAQYNPCQTSALQNCRIINLCCFKPLSV